MFEKALSSAINNALPMLTIFVVVMATVRLTSLKSNGKGLSLHEEILNLLFLVYVLLLFELLTGTENSLGSGMNLVPFKEILRYDIGSRLFYYNVLGNILIFVPFGYFVSRYVRIKHISQIIIDALIASLTVELVQLRVGRSFDIDDIILNVCGGIVGYFIFVGLDAIRTHLPRFLQKDFIYDIICIIIFVAFILYVLRLSGIRWF